MYTVIFARERQESRYDGIIRVECFKTEKEVHDFVRIVTFNQLRENSNKLRYDGERYYYGDYGFLVLKNGETVSDHNFSLTTDFVDIPCESEDGMIDFHGDICHAVDQNDNLQSIIDGYEILERDYKYALLSNSSDVKRKKEIDSEKALLKELLEKYPEMKY